MGVLASVSSTINFPMLSGGPGTPNSNTAIKPKTPLLILTFHSINGIRLDTWLQHGHVRSSQSC